MNHFEVQDLSLNISGKQILSNVSFSIEKGSFNCVIGPNGAGKSSLLGCLGRLNKDYRGEILLDGVSLSSMSEKEIAKRIAWVHQSGTEQLCFSVREFAEFSRFPWHGTFSGKTQEDAECVSRALEIAGVSDLADRILNTLSGGERQRAMLAAALAQETDILFLDEPTSFLDYRHQEELLTLVKKINKEKGLTVVFVTHDINIAVCAADRLFAVKNGRLHRTGTAEQLLSHGVLEELFETEFERFMRGTDKITAVMPKGLLR